MAVYSYKARAADGKLVISTCNDNRPAAAHGHGPEQTHLERGRRGFHGHFHARYHAGHHGRLIP